MHVEPEPRETAPPRPPRVRWSVVAVTVVAILLGVVGGGGLALARTQAGQRVALDTGLAWAQDRLLGALHVDGIRSASLTRGATLIGLRLEAEGGARFLEADSVLVRYSISRLIAGDRRLASVRLWGLRVRLAPVLPEGPLNVTRLVRPTVGPAGPATPFRIGRLQVERGLVEVAPGAATGSGDAELVTLRRLGLDLTDLVVNPTSGNLLEARLRELAASVEALEEPVPLTRAEGRLSFGGDGLRLSEARFGLGGSGLAGSLHLGPEREGGPWSLDLDVTSEGEGRLADLAFVDPRVPPGTFRGGARVRVGTGVDVRLRSVAVELEGSSVALDGGVVLDGGWRLDGLEVSGSPLALEDVQAWLPDSLPLDGWVSGRATFTGDLRALRSDGRLTYAPSGAGRTATTARYDGTFHPSDSFRVTGLHAEIAPLEYRLLSDFLPRAEVRGTGEAVIELTGGMTRGFEFRADMVHRDPARGRSDLRAEGTAGRSAGRWTLDARAETDSLGLEAFARLAPDAGLRGWMVGSVAAVGPLDSLSLSGNLRAAGGSVEFEAEVDAIAPASAYRVFAEAVDLPLSELAAAVPPRTTWTGTASVEGRGLGLDSLDVGAALTLHGSMVRGVPIDSSRVRVTAAQGVLRIDTLEADFSGVRIRGNGRLGLREGVERVARFEFQADSLRSLRPLLMGDSLIARDTLSNLDMESLRLDGIDPDTLPTTAEIRMSGAARGVVELRGWVEDFDMTADVALTRGAMGSNRLDSAAVRLTAEALPSRDAGFDVEARARGMVFGSRTFEAVELAAVGRERAGDGRILLVGRPGEQYSAAGSFSLDGNSGSVRLQEAVADLDSLVLQLAAPAVVEWDSMTVRVRELELARSGPDPMSVRADGTVSRAGASDFRLEVEGLHAERVAHIAQVPDFQGEGHVDLTLAVQGPAANPAIDLFFQIDEPRYGSMSLSRLGGSLAYREGDAQVRVEAYSPGRRVFHASGRLPLDLAMTRTPGVREGGAIDLTVVSDSLEAAVPLAYLTSLEDVVGTITGEFRLQGTLDAIEPSGVVRLSGAEWTVAALGARQRGIEGSVTLRPDRTIEVDLRSVAPGSSTVTGTVVLDPLADPVLDLDLGFAGFQAVSRRDMEAAISGALDLTGSYRRPVVSGRLSVDRGTLFVDEFVRRVDVVDLNDPRIFEHVDTTVFDVPGLMAGIQNPFTANLRVNVDLVVPQEAWLRSQEMNVEMGGELVVVYDRTEGDLVMVGSLQALRGSYRVLGRTFDVDQGTVGFLGTPGVNPTLDLTAVSRIRRPDDDALAVTARVEGTLTQPRVTLSTDDQGVAESDLVSYLIFGRPSHELGTGQAQLVGAGGLGGIGASAEGLLGTWLTGAVAARYGAVVGQRLGLDYLSVSQSGDYSLLSNGVLNSFASAQVEVGQYLGRDIFVIFVLRPLGGQVAGGVFGGARLEWAIDEAYRFEGYVEDRFLRSRVLALGSLDASQVFGVFVFREWGY